MDIVIGVLLIIVLYFGSHQMVKRRQRRREKFLDSYRFHPQIRDKVAARHPHLQPSQLDEVMEGMRDYFRFCLQARKRMVSMPSQVVDDAWHEFILFTRSYQLFCLKTFGRFLHHTPAVVMKSPTQAQEGIQRAWRLACHHEKLSPKYPARLPRLFALDGQLKIVNGFTYSIDCKNKSSPNYGDGYCASHIGCSSGCGGDSGSSSADTGGFFSGSDSDSGCSSDSGGCGGGCGGGD